MDSHDELITCHTFYDSSETRFSDNRAQGEPSLKELHPSPNDGTSALDEKSACIQDARHTHCSTKRSETCSADGVVRRREYTSRVPPG